MAYRFCKWCSGRGCVCCTEQSDIDFDKAHPEGIEPIFIADPQNQEDMELLKNIIGKDAIEHAYGPNGRGVIEINELAEAARKTQAARKDNIASGDE